MSSSHCIPFSIHLQALTWPLAIWHPHGPHMLTLVLPAEAGKSVHHGSHHHTREYSQAFCPPNLLQDAGPQIIKTLIINCSQESCFSLSTNSSEINDL